MRLDFLFEADSRFRELEREAAAGYVPEVRLLQQRVRRGDISFENVRLAGILGDEASRQLMDIEGEVKEFREIGDLDLVLEIFRIIGEDGIWNLVQDCLNAIESSVDFLERTHDTFMVNGAVRDSFDSLRNREIPNELNLQRLGQFLNWAAMHQDEDRDQRLQSAVSLVGVINSISWILSGNAKYIWRLRRPLLDVSNRYVGKDNWIESLIIRELLR